MKKYMFLLMMGGLVIVMTSCFSSKKMVYLEDMQVDSLYAISRYSEMKIKQDDKLNIVVSSKKSELAAPFNVSTGNYQVDTEGGITTASNAAVKENGYIVDRHGEIEFPILGMLHVEGMTLEELAQQIKERLVNERYLDDPIVSAELLNMKITVMGEVNRIGVLSVQGKRLTLMEALSQAGGLTSNACLDKVAVIREEGGGRKMLVTDLRSVSVFSSPGFYLQQNDIVYVQPQAARSNDKENRSWRFYSTGIGLIGIITSLFVLFK